MTECPTCLGRGLVMERERRMIKNSEGFESIDQKDYPKLIRCPQCKGDGKVE